MSEKLKPCLLCNGEASEIEYGNLDGIVTSLRVQCNECYPYGGIVHVNLSKYTKEDAYREWNELKVEDVAVRPEGHKRIYK